MAPREGLESFQLKLGHTGPSMEPHCGPHAGKSGYPRSQDADSSPRVELGFEAKPKGKCGAPRAPTACGLGRCVAIDGTWVPPLPHATSATAQFDETPLHAEENHHCVRSWRPAVGLLLGINEERGGAPLLISLFSQPASPSSSWSLRLADLP
ncbi:hypothetical protein ACQJBY_067960 [Aegilops geniculata]